MVHLFILHKTMSRPTKPHTLVAVIGNGFDLDLGLDTRYSDFCYDRKELAVMLKDMGADINTSVSKKTDIVLVGSKPGPAKMKKIEDLINEGYPIKKISQKELIAILDGNYDVIQ